MEKDTFLIQVDHRLMSHIVPGPVFAQGAFKWRPGQWSHTSRRAQIDSLATASRPNLGWTFFVTGYDQKVSDYMAAYLAQKHVEARSDYLVWWLPLRREEPDRYTGRFSHPVPKAKREQFPSLIVCTGIDADSPSSQCVAVEDLRAAHPSVPLIIVGSGVGLNPKAMGLHLRMAFHACAHITPLRPQ